ncbi:MAG: hypothetical protein Q9213_001185 [Squamulea squamosa]
MHKKLKSSANASEVTSLPKQEWVLSSRPVPSIPHKDIPSDAPWLPCAFGTLEAPNPWLVGCVRKESQEHWAIHLQIHPGRFGSPSITLRVQTRQGSTISGKGMKDNMYLRWFVDAPNDVDDLQIHRFQIRPFAHWYQCASEQSQSLDEVALVNSSDRCNQALILSCRLQQPSLEEFHASASWNVLPERVARNVEILQEPREVDFLFFADDAIRNRHIPLMQHHIAESIPILSQYDDLATGDFTLNSIQDAPTVEEVGDGLYLRETAQSYSYRNLTSSYSYIKLENNVPMVNVPPIDLCESTGSNNNNELFHHIVEVGNSHFANDRQMSVIKGFSKVHNNTLAVVGPSGTGKIRLSSFAIQALLRLGHRVLVCAPSDNSLDKVVEGICNSPYDWLRGKNLLRLDSTSAKRPTTSSAADRGVIQADVDAGMVGHDMGLDRNEYSDNKPKVPYSGLQPTLIPFDMTLQSQRLANDDIIGSKPTIHGECAKATPSNMQNRVFSHVDLLFATLNDAGSQDFYKLGFKPTVVFVVDAGRASLASLFIPLTRFSSWVGLILFGDLNRSWPRMLAYKETEILDNSLTSALESIVAFQTNVTYLDTQYRMPPAISQLLSGIFHNGGLITHDRAYTDTEHRQKLRKLTFDHFGIRGAEDMQGSEYMFLDVPNGLSHSEAGGDDLYNYANVEAIIRFVKLLVEEGIPGVDIVILCFYEAQVRLILQHLQATNDTRLDFVKASTVDSFHGQVASIVIVDFVQAYPQDAFYKQQYRGSKSSNGGKNLTEHRIYAKSSSSLTDTRRVNLALTRAKDGLVVVGQLALFACKVWVDNGRLGNVLFEMAYYSKERRLASTMIYPEAFAGAALIEERPRNEYVDRKLNSGYKLLRSSKSG